MGEPREMTACSYGAVEAGAGAARQHGSAYRNYMAAVIGAWAVLFAATVLIVGYASQSSIALEQQAHTQMLEFTFEPERNVFEEFDPEGSAPEPWKQEYDLAKEANYEMINIKDAAPDAAEAGAITEGVEDPSAILRTQALFSTEAMASAFAHCHVRCLPGASRSRHRGTVLSLKRMSFGASCRFVSVFGV